MFKKNVNHFNYDKEKFSLLIYFLDYIFTNKIPRGYDSPYSKCRFIKRANRMDK